MCVATGEFGIAMQTEGDIIGIILGRKVDLSTPIFLNEYFREQMRGETRMIYEKRRLGL